MSASDAKSVVIEFFKRLDASDIAGAVSMMTDDATWWIAGKPGTNPTVGTLPKEKIGKLFHRMLSQMTEGIRMTVKECIAEGNKVAIELESYAKLKNGRVYNQQYHVAAEVRDGRICKVREYLDTQHVLAVWFAPEQGSSAAPQAGRG